MRAGVEKEGGNWGAFGVVDVLIVPRPDHYDVAYFMKYHPTDTVGHLILLHVVDEDGSMKIRYVEGWNDLGWFRPAEDLPYRPVTF